MTARLETRAVHAGEARRRPYDALTVPVVMSSAYTFADTEAVQTFVERRELDGTPDRYEYGRYGNPTQDAAERKLADLDGGERALLFSSGMAAITTSVLALLSTGDHLVVAGGAYRRTRAFAAETLPRFGIETSFCGPDEIPERRRPSTRAVFLEIPTNPHLRVADLESIAEWARREGVLTMVDATFATPINLRPIEWGADLVIHSATKYIGGHNDLLAGVVVGRAEQLDAIEEARGILGGVAAPMEAYLVLRGVKTLPIRVHRQNESAQRVAEHLETHPAIARVHYPGLASHPDHAIARRLMTGFGGVVSFEPVGGRPAASACVDRLEIPRIGPTLGGVESIVQQQALFISPDPVERARYGIPDGLIRYAVGIEDIRDLIADLDRALGPLATRGGDRDAT